MCIVPRWVVNPVMNKKKKLSKICKFPILEFLAPPFFIQNLSGYGTKAGSRHFDLNPPHDVCPLG